MLTEAEAAESEKQRCVICGQPHVGPSQTCRHCCAKLVASTNFHEKPAPAVKAEISPKLPELEEHKPQEIDSKYHPELLTTENKKTVSGESLEQDMSFSNGTCRQGGIGGRRGIWEGSIKLRSKTVGDETINSGKINVGAKGASVGVGVSVDGDGNTKGMVEAKVGKTTGRLSTNLDNFAVQQEFDGPVDVPAICNRLSQKLKEQGLDPGLSDKLMGPIVEAVAEGGHLDSILDAALTAAAKSQPLGPFSKNTSRVKLSMEKGDMAEHHEEDQSFEVSEDEREIACRLKETDTRQMGTDIAVTGESGVRSGIDLGILHAHGEWGATTTATVKNAYIESKSDVKTTQQKIYVPDGKIEIETSPSGTCTTTTKEIIAETETQQSTETKLAGMGMEGKKEEETRDIDSKKERIQQIHQTIVSDPVQNEKVEVKEGFLWTSETKHSSQEQKIFTSRTVQTVTEVPAQEGAKPTKSTQIHEKESTKTEMRAEVYDHREESPFSDKKTTKESVSKVIKHSSGAEEENHQERQRTEETIDLGLVEVRNKTETRKKWKVVRDGKRKNVQKQITNKKSQTVSPSPHVKAGVNSGIGTAARMSGRAGMELLMNGETDVTPEQVAEAAGSAALDGTARSMVGKVATKATKCSHAGQGATAAVMSAVNNADRLLGESDRERAEAVAEVAKDGAFSYAISKAPEALGAKCAGSAAAAVEAVGAGFAVCDKLMKGDAEGAVKEAGKGVGKACIAAVTAPLGPVGWFVGGAAASAWDAVFG